jgi:hypothetical protein
MSERRTSKLQRLRAAIKAILTSDFTDPQSGAVLPPLWEEGAVIAGRQTDIWNDLAVAISGATHGTACTISIPTGEGTEEDGLENDLIVAITNFAGFATTPGEEPEEILFEETVRRLHNAIPVFEGSVPHWNYRLRYQNWSEAGDLIPEDRTDAFQFARQFTFKIRFSLEPDLT